ncbi:MAG: chromosomal replication initiator protein [Parcubacteria group bacterium Greene0714_21]|nr:MAG: chromosomal replication initiator protein [Parcubacteria group bacterium Greene0416_39]TSC98344.1 MAG: chromosomal replication initiator protein [Parcubacteria group bacterium Greene1014_47]TSD03994.1 MAG: chromosomal replication initiator protein [Parcubacteria group bacterium Greene0714_21]
MTKEELWQATLAQLQFQISPANFATWLKNTYIFSQKEGQVLVSVPNNFSKEWLEQKYNKLIFKILRSLQGDLKEVSYAVERQGVKQKEAALRTPTLPQEPQLEFQELRVDKSTNLNSRYGFSNFVVGPFNELAHAASTAVAKSPGSVYNPLFIYGGTGLGKTHLLQAVGNQVAKDLNQKKIRYMSSERFTSGVVTSIRNRTIDTFRSSWRELDILILDDVQFLTGKDKTQEELFHTFNTLYERGKQIIFSSDRPPKAIAALEERLRSRFEGGMLADISSPDFETRMAIVKSKAQERNVEVPDEIASYIASNIQRNIRELEGAITRLIAFFQLNSRAPTLQEAKGLLKNVIQAPSKFVTPKRIIQAVSEFYDLKEKEMIAASRKQEVVRPRQVAMYLLRGELRSSYPFIGKRFGGKDHTTAIYACSKIEKELQASESLVEEINLIRQRIYSV